MKIRLGSGVLLTILMTVFQPAGAVQDDKTVEKTAAGDAGRSSGQEVEVNEDNYRQFMELKDAPGQRNVIPEDAFKPGSGAQKLDKLPEDSQKHLRNQLREIIMTSDPWQPSDEGTEYPYVASAAASTDPSLEKQEKEAWGELVQNYHKREAQIVNNSARRQAAMASGEALKEGQENQGSVASKQPGQSGKGQESSRQTRSAPDDDIASYSPNTPGDTDAENTAGVSQNALEFLRGQATQANDTTSMKHDGTGIAENKSQQEAVSQNDASAQQQINKDISNSTMAATSQSTESESTAGSRQNALDYLKERGTRQDEQISTTSGTSDNTNTTEGTLSIEDLINAQGVRDTIPSEPLDPHAPVGVDALPPVDNPPHKDGESG